MDQMIFERKSIGDLFGSFSDEVRYQNEKEKIERAKELGLNYVLAIEGTVFDVRKGHSYSKKDGTSQLRQLFTIERKYGIKVMYFSSRAEMAFTIQEFFLATQRAKLETVPLREIKQISLPDTPFYVRNPDGTFHKNLGKYICVVCGETKALEMHHWAPKHLFDDDADNWPQSPLCRECHLIWHNKVTPNMSQGEKIEQTTN